MLVRPEGRTLRAARFSIPSKKSPQFQCSSAPKDGRYDRSCQACFHVVAVSMLVRPEGRTLQKRDLEDRLTLPSFNARPPRRTDATGQCLKRVWEVVFQCSSAPKDGRYSLNRGWCINSLSFNARPPRRTDATENSLLWKGLRKEFQCSSAPKDGRYYNRSCHPAPLICFNARPPRRTDATGGMVGAKPVYFRFQCSSAPKDGRYKNLRAKRVCLDRFQCSSAPKDGRYPKRLLQPLRS